MASKAQRPDSPYTQIMKLTKLTYTIWSLELKAAIDIGNEYMWYI